MTIVNFFQMMKTVKEIKETTGLHITVNHSGKMDGMQSLSTSPYKNMQCERNAKIAGSICEKCFSRKQMKRWSPMEKPLIKNFEILTSKILPVDELPIINALYFRFEAFGDLANEIQAANYLNIAKHNPGVRFAWWTKNARFIKKALENGFEKPDNLVIVYSSLYLNKAEDVAKMKRLYPFIDKIFTVYDKKSSCGVAINCGERQCLKCRLCYEKNGIDIINEIEK